MNKSIYFILGLVLAGVGMAGHWALKTETKPPEPESRSNRKVSLLTINYIPTLPSKPVDQGTFWEVTAPHEIEPAEKKLADLKGKPVILHFWATWCPPCVAELPDLDVYAKKYGNTAHIIAIAADFQDIKKIREFYGAKGIRNLTITVDKDNVLSRSFRASALPTTVFIDSKGHEIGRIQGAVEWAGTAGRLLNTHLSRN